MVASGFAMVFVALWATWRQWRTPSIAGSRAFLWAVAASAPLGFIAIEAGWFVTELGRQPWIIQGVMRTADAATPMPGLIVPFLTLTLLYLVLAAIVILLLVRHVRESPGGSEPQPRSGEVVR
jgi:cytochrome d ubiquinol oxidase subunit I